MAAESGLPLSIGDIIALVGALVAAGAAWGRSEYTGNAASKEAEKANKRADDAHVVCAAIQAQLSMFREKAAETYVNRDAMRELKDEFSVDFEKLERMLTESFGQLSNRLDRILETTREHSSRTQGRT